ncbi:hypothetical protein R1sor_000668 [Riccia sorocarpa]|uniref:Partial AB-hydrolase lipase domain-containing protein n=1 Tax=Riccia sorocarpa TaxID=122646 RepID=A0ABD3GXY5_9MARC
MMASVLMRGVLIALVFLTLLEIHSVQAQGTLATSLCDEFILPNGYPCQEITTQDGFLLGLYNIPFGRNRANRALGPPVLLVPGVLSGGDNYLLRGPNNSLGFLLADAGYDVYIGNNRNGYWDWTFDELAAFDLPSLVNYVYNRRGSKKLFYIGHSQAGGLANGDYVDSTTLRTIVCNSDPTICQLLGTPSAFVKQTAQLRKFDRGTTENLQRYGQATPPFYNLSQFPSSSFPQLFFTGGIDQIADPIDVARLLRELPNAGNRRVINLPLYGHEDLILSNRANLDLFPDTFFRSN